MLLLKLGLVFVVAFAWGMVFEMGLAKRRRLKAQAKLSLAQKQVLNTTAGKTAQREINRKLGLLSQSVSKRQAEHLEMYAAAYLKHTNMPPDQVELVQEMHGHEKITWRFVKRNDLH